MQRRCGDADPGGERRSLRQLQTGHILAQQQFSGHDQQPIPFPLLVGIRSLRRKATAQTGAVEGEIDSGEVMTGEGAHRFPADCCA